MATNEIQELLHMFDDGCGFGDPPDFIALKA